MILDATNNVYISGYYTSATLTIKNANGSTFQTLSNTGNNDIFIAKYNSNGICQWVTQIASTGNDRPVNMILDSINNVYVSFLQYPMFCPNLADYMNFVVASYIL
jgi:hypothetical protein